MEGRRLWGPLHEVAGRSQKGVKYEDTGAEGCEGEVYGLRVVGGV